MILANLDDETPAHIAAECQDCGHLWPLDLLNDLQDPLQRVLPGDEMPAGECPECGAACLLLPDPAPTTTSARAPTKHTPGPWGTAVYAAGVLPPLDPELQTLTVYAEGTQHGDVAYIGNGLFEPETNAANWRLIISAPALAEALADCINAIETLATGGKVTNQIRRILDRAERALRAAGGEP